MIFERQRVTPGARWLESLVITVSGPVLGSLVTPDDPYLLRAQFPWLVLAPLLVGLQHGVWTGLASSLLLCAGAVWQALSLGPLPGSFASWGIGCLVIAVVAGQFRDSVRGRSEQHAARADELQDRLERSERTRHLIHLSHAKLVERVAASRSSLVAVIDGAQRQMSDAGSMHELGQILLDVLASQGNLHAASLYVAQYEGAGLLVQPVASFGGSGASTAKHALVLRAFTSGKLAAIVDAGESVSADRSVLAAVPLITSQRRILGVVAVHQMSFMAFQAEHLNQLFVLAGHLSDMLYDRWSAVQAEPGELAEASAASAPLAATTLETPALALPAVHVEPVPDAPHAPDTLDEFDTIVIEVDAPSAPDAEIVSPAQRTAVERTAAFHVPRIELPPARVVSARETQQLTLNEPKLGNELAEPAATQAQPVAELAVTTKSSAQHSDGNPITRVLHQLAPTKPAPVLQPTAAAATITPAAATITPAAATITPAAATITPATAAGAPVAPAHEPVKLQDVRVPAPVAKPAAAAPVPHNHRKREDVTETRALTRKPRPYPIKSTHVTREFPAVRLPASETQPAAGASLPHAPLAQTERPRAQAGIRSQVAEAAAHRSSSL